MRSSCSDSHPKHASTIERIRRLIALAHTAIYSSHVLPATCLRADAHALSFTPRNTAGFSRNGPEHGGTPVAVMASMRDYPVHLEVTSPQRYDRVQLLLRILFAIVLGWIGFTTGWLVWGLYLVLPVIAAIAISSSRTSYFEGTAPQVWRVLSWLLKLSAYMMLLVDRFPKEDDGDVRVAVRYTGRPTAGSSIARFVTSIPSGIVLGALWFVSSILWLWGAVTILFAASVPAWLLGFQRGVLRWQARLVAYHASMIEEYPPFSFDTDDGHDDILHARAV